MNFLDIDSKVTQDYFYCILWIAREPGIQSRGTERGIRLYFVMGELRGHIADHARWKILLDRLWKI